MNPTDFGKLIASLRREHEDEDGAPWTQSRLAQECNLAAGSAAFNENVISSLERGRRHPDSDVLLALAGALRLTSSERREFFLAASGVEAADISRQDDQPGQVFSRLVDRLQELRAPAAILDGYSNVLAVNQLILELLEFASASGIGIGPGEEESFGYNLMQFVFSEHGSRHFRKLMGDGFEDFAFLAMSMFRTFSLECRSTPYFQVLFRELWKSRLFRSYWSDIYLSEGSRQQGQPDIRASTARWGDLSLFVAIRQAFTVAGDLHLAVFVPADDNTMKACHTILGQSPATAVLVLSAWPDTRR